MSAPTETKQRVEKLRELIEYHRYLYHVENKSEISEEALDSLKDELKKIESQYPELVTSDSPTQRVAGQALSQFNKITHKVAQWSFDDAFDRADLENFKKRAENYLAKEKHDSIIEYFCELKIDGLKIILEYVDGVLKHAATRGDGKVGEDVTASARTIESIPLTLRKPVSGIFEGEVWLSKNNFDNLNKEQEKKGLELYANPRNVAAGTMRQLDPRIVSERKLDCFIYDVAQYSGDLPESQEKELLLLKKLGFKTNPHNQLCTDLLEVWDFYTRQTKEKDSHDYWVDGVVLKINNLETQILLGYTGKAPRFAIALKFPAEQKTTIVESIELQIGRTGVITPVANLQAVSLAGTTVRRATLHNQDEIERLDLRVGDTVIVQKAGDIIPQVVQVLTQLRPKKTKKYQFPEKVFGCGGDGSIERIPGQAAYRCAHMNSNELVSRKLEYAVSKKALYIEGLGKKIIQRFVQLGYLQSIADIYRLHKKEKEILDLEGFKEKSVEKLIREIEQRREISMSRLLVALSIPEVGEETAVLLAEEFGTIEKLRSSNFENLESVHGIGSVMAEKIIEFFNNTTEIKQLDDLLSEINISYSPRGTVGKGFFSGKTVVITGTFENYSRDQLKDTVRSQGGKIASSVSKNTDYLLAGEKAGSKLDKANQLDVKVLHEDSALKYLG